MSGSFQSITSGSGIRNLRKTVSSLSAAYRRPQIQKQSMLINNRSNNANQLWDAQRQYFTSEFKKGSWSRNLKKCNKWISINYAYGVSGSMLLGIVGFVTESHETKFSESLKLLPDETPDETQKQTSAETSLNDTQKQTSAETSLNETQKQTSVETSIQEDNDDGNDEYCAATINCNELTFDETIHIIELIVTSNGAEIRKASKFRAESIKIVTLLLKHNPMAIAKVPSPFITREMIDIVIGSVPVRLLPKKLLTEDDYCLSVKSDNTNYYDTPKEFRTSRVMSYIAPHNLFLFVKREDVPNGMWEIILRNNGMNLGNLPYNRRNSLLCQIAAKENCSARKFIPSHLLEIVDKEIERNGVTECDNCKETSNCDHCEELANSQTQSGVEQCPVIANM